MTTWPAVADYQQLPWPVTDDPALVSPPCVLVHTTDMEEVGACVWELRVEVLAVAPGPSQPGTRELWRTMAPALAGLPGVGRVEEVTWDGMPALRAVQTKEIDL